MPHFNSIFHIAALLMFHLFVSSVFMHFLFISFLFFLVLIHLYRCFYCSHSIQRVDSIHFICVCAYRRASELKVLLILRIFLVFKLAPTQYYILPFAYTNIRLNQSYVWIIFIYSGRIHSYENTLYVSYDLRLRACMCLCKHKYMNDVFTALTFGRSSQHSELLYAASRMTINIIYPESQHT